MKLFQVILSARLRTGYRRTVQGVSIKYRKLLSLVSYIHRPGSAIYQWGYQLKRFYFRVFSPKTNHYLTIGLNELKMEAAKHMNFDKELHFCEKPESLLRAGI